MTRPALDVIRISQMVTQAAWNGPLTGIQDTSVLQLPHVTPAKLEAWNRKAKKDKTIRDYFALNEAQREQLLTETFELTPEQIADVHAVEKLLPSDVCKCFSPGVFFAKLRKFSWVSSRSLLSSVLCLSSPVKKKSRNSTGNTFPLFFLPLNIHSP